MPEYVPRVRLDPLPQKITKFDFRNVMFLAEARMYPKLTVETEREGLRRERGWSCRSVLLDFKAF